MQSQFFVVDSFLFEQQVGVNYCGYHGYLVKEYKLIVHYYCGCEIFFHGVWKAYIGVDYIDHCFSAIRFEKWCCKRTNY